MCLTDLALAQLPKKQRHAQTDNTQGDNMRRLAFFSVENKKTGATKYAADLNHFDNAKRLTQEAIDARDKTQPAERETTRRMEAIIGGHNG